MDLSITTTMPIMITQIVAMFLTMFVGAAMYKAGMITKEGSSVLTNIASYVTNPAVLIRSLAKQFDASTFSNIIGVAGTTVVLMFVCIGIATVAYGRKGDAVARFGIIVSNIGFMGIPLVETVIGSAYVIYVSTCIAVQVCFTWSYGAYIVSGDKGAINPKKIITNPNILAVIIGFAMFLFSFELSGILYSFVNTVANMNTGVAMLTLGVFLAQADIPSLLKSPSIYKASIMRLIVSAALTILLLTFIPLTLECKATVLIAFSAPCGMMTSLMPQLFGKDSQFGAGLVVVSTLLSLITMPLMLMFGLLVF